jgi:3-deoxy-D-manno-octulosonate 8-phosphate phosphatase (KDO 8-P phosphatase)
MSKSAIVKKNISIDAIDMIVFDFDGVLTDNLVHIDKSGSESVTCSRSDGLAFDVFRKLGKKVYILSTEKNSVVSARAKKIQVPAIQGSSNKVETLKGLSKELQVGLDKVFYVGNDVNDYYAMKLCGYTACPSDSHCKIKEISDVILKTSGGKGVARELLENVFNIDFIKILYDNN